MKESGLVCKQPGAHKYKKATVEDVDIKNHLNREFTVQKPNKVWCEDIAYIWTGRAGHIWQLYWIFMPVSLLAGLCQITRTAK